MDNHCRSLVWSSISTDVTGMHMMPSSLMPNAFVPFFLFFDNWGRNWIRPDREGLLLRVVEHPCHVKRMQTNNC